MYPTDATALCQTAKDFEEGCEADIARAKDAAERGLEKASPGDLVAVLGAYDEAVGALSDAGARASLARNVHPDAGLRTVAEQCERRIDALSAELSLDPALYRALDSLDVSGEDPATRRFVSKSLKDFRRSGVDRDEATRARVRALREERLLVGQEFGRNIKDDVRRLELDPAELEGLPDDWRRGHPPSAEGRVAVTTDAVDYLPFMTYACSDRAREALFRLHRLRGHPENLSVLSRMLNLRSELAHLLGYPNYASYVTEDKMICSAESAAAFIEKMAQAAEKRLHADFAQLLLAKRELAPDSATVEPWDSAFLSERVKEKRYGFDARSARPYFEYRAVRDGVLDVTSRVFGVRWEKAELAPVWHPHVEAWDAFEGDERVGRIYLDMHPREGKYRHFAQFALASGQAGKKLPEGVLVCNFPRPGEQGPALLDHGDVRTFFHEFGHLMHHLLGGRTRWAAQSGVATEWDFVEAPSQLLEEWIWEPDVLRSFARHFETGEPIPADLVRHMREADEYGKGLMVRQQMFYAAVSLEFHRRPPEGLDTTSLAAELQARYTPFPHLPGTFFQLSFGHLDGYSALYYTYMWSLVIAKDLMGPFRKRGFFDTEVARRYREAVLEPGGSKPADELVSDFLGRPYAFDAFYEWLDAESYQYRSTWI